jgi:uncharacterized membrane protein
MARKIDKADVFALAVLGGGALITAALYPELPAQIPIRFDARGVAKAWMDRSAGAWLLPALGVATWGVLRFAGGIVPASWRARVTTPAMTASAFVFAAFFTAMQVLVLYASMHPTETIGRGLALAIGVMWLALAQLMPRLRRNPLIGVRTAWTLTSDENWLRTHRVAAYAFAGGGAIAVLAGVGGGAAASPIAIASILTSTLIPAVHSYLLARRLPPTS